MVTKEGATQLKLHTPEEIPAKVVEVSLVNTDQTFTVLELLPGIGEKRLLTELNVRPGYRRQDMEIYECGDTNGTLLAVCSDAGEYESYEEERGELMAKTLKNNLTEICGGVSIDLPRRIVDRCQTWMADSGCRHLPPEITGPR